MTQGKAHDQSNKAQRPVRQPAPVTEEQILTERALTDERAAAALRDNPPLAGQMGGAQRARAVSGLQKAHGNAAVQRMLQRQVEEEEEEVQPKRVSETQVQRQEIPEEELELKPAAGAVQRDWEIGLTPDYYVKKGLERVKRLAAQRLGLGKDLEAVPQVGSAVGGGVGSIIEDIAGQVNQKPEEGVPPPGPLSAEITARIDAERGNGQALDDAARTEMEAAMGADFGEVRVHTGPAADELNRELGAAAFTTGRDVFFRDGMYQPGDRDGRELLAHELTHVVQQGGEGRPHGSQGPLTLGPVGDTHEQEADHVAGEITNGEATASQAAAQPGAVQRGFFDNLLGGVGSALGGGGGGIGGLLGGVGSALGGGGAGGMLGGLLGTARGLIGSGAGAAREAVGAGAGAASGALGRMSGMASGLLGNLTGMGRGLVGQGAGALGGLVGNLGGMATGAISSLAGRATEAVGGLPGGGFLSGLIGNLAGMGTSAVERGVGAASGMVGRGAGMAENAIGSLGGMGERAIGRGTGMVGNFIGAGTQAAEGAVGMAEQGAGGVLDMVEGIANTAGNMPEMPFGPMMPQIPETPGAGGVGGMFSDLLGRFF